MPPNHLILCCPLLLFPRIRVFSNESALRIRWPKYWSLSFSISSSNEHTYTYTYTYTCTGCAGSLLLRRLFLVAGSGSYSPVTVLRLLTAVTFLTVERGLSGTWAQKLAPGSSAQAQKLQRTGLVVPQHVGSSQTRDQTHVSCIGRQILYHWATREALHGQPYITSHSQGNGPAITFAIECNNQGSDSLIVSTDPSQDQRERIKSDMCTRGQESWGPS